VPDVFDLIATHPRESFWLIPEVWGRYDHTRTMRWARLEFNPSNAASVPDEPGVYAFVLEHHVAKDLPAAFPMYVGMSEGSIRDRYRKYQRQAFRGRRGRPKLDRLFLTWKHHLAFYYVTDLAGDTPPTLEQNVINTVMPPMNKDDFSADVKRLMGAF
jgi:hypothetical protein